MRMILTFKQIEAIYRTTIEENNLDLPQEWEIETESGDVLINQVGDNLVGRIFVR
jgi:hypothetical protein